MDDLDALIGKNLARLRGDLSQADLAREMKERGFKWSQATVWSIEKGERPLRLSESKHVAEILGVKGLDPAAAFLKPEASSILRHHLDGVYRAHLKVKEATNGYLNELESLAETADLISDKDFDAVDNHIWFAVNDWLTKQSPLAIVRQIMKEHRVEDLTGVPGEMADAGVTTLRELVDARDTTAKERGFEDAEMEWAHNMRVVGNYSRMMKPMAAEQNIDNGEHPEEA